MSNLYKVIFRIDDEMERRAKALREVSRTTFSGTSVVDTSTIPKAKLDRMQKVVERSVASDRQTTEAARPRT